MKLSRGLNPPKTGFNFPPKIGIENWIQFLVEPNIFERPLKFKPPLKFIEFGLCINKLGKIFVSSKIKLFCKCEIKKKSIFNYSFFT